MPSHDMPKFGTLPGEEVSKARIDAANAAILEKERQKMIGDLEAQARETEEKDISPGQLMRRFGDVLERMESDFKHIEVIGPGHPDRAGSIRRLTEEIQASLTYFEEAGKRLKIADIEFSRSLNKLRAYKEYLLKN